VGDEGEMHCVPGPLPGAPKGRSAAQRRGDWLTMVALTLVSLGIVLVYSSSSIRMELKVSDSTIILRRQLLWAFLAGCTFLIVRSTGIELLRRHSRLFFGATCLLLVAVMVPGISHKIGGARRWISFSGMNLQPSEIAKITMVLLVATLVCERREKLDSFKEGFMWVVAPVLAIAALVIVEPDFGTASLLVFVGMAMLVVAGVRWRHLLVSGIPALLGIVGLVLVKGDYVRARIGAFLKPGSDLAGVGYQVRQALIALGSGGFWGQGLGASRQKRLFLPDVHTDFIFALVGEELGFVGAATVVGLYGLLVALGFLAAFRAKDRFSFLVAFGLTLTIGLQAIINIAVATGSMPPKGIALPLISFGGSSLMLCAACIGVLVNIAEQGAPEPISEPIMEEVSA